VTAVAADPRHGAETRSCGRGCKGHRDYAWVWPATASPRHWILILRSLSDTTDVAFYYCHLRGPAGVSARPDQGRQKEMAGGGMFPAGKAADGLDQHQVRPWRSFHRHAVLSICAQALPAIAAARPAPPGSDPSAASTAAQPAARHDTGKLPASADDQPSGGDPGLVRSAPRGPPICPASDRAYEPHRPRPGLRLVTLAATPSGPRPMAPPPRPAQRRPVTRSQPTERRPSCNKSGL
jgi:hypothetical protein